MFLKIAFGCKDKIRLGLSCAKLSLTQASYLQFQWLALVGEITITTKLKDKTPPVKDRNFWNDKVMARLLLLIHLFIRFHIMLFDFGDICTV